MTQSSTPPVPATPPGGTARNRERRVIRSRELQTLVRSRVALISAGFLAVVIFVSLFAGVISPYEPSAQDASLRFAGPGTPHHLLGTDFLGRDLATRLFYGGRVTLAAAAIGAGLGAVIGIPTGLASGYLGGWVDRALSAVFDAIFSIPPLVLAFAIVGVLGAGLTNVMIAMGIVLAPRFYRVGRSATRSVATDLYVLGAEAIGCSKWRILWRHILPNASGPLLVQISFSIGIAATAEASLSFLGLGVQDPASSWGSIIRDAYDQIYTSTWALVPPSVLLVATIGALSVLGDAIRDAWSGAERYKKVSARNG